MAAMRDAAVAACAAVRLRALADRARSPAFAAELPCPTNDPARPFEHIALHRALQHERAAGRRRINCGYTAAGLPIGLQIVGQRFDDLGVLQVARAWERMRPAQRPWPEPPA